MLGDAIKVSFDVWADGDRDEKFNLYWNGTCNNVIIDLVDLLSAYLFDSCKDLSPKHG